MKQIKKSILTVLMCLGILVSAVMVPQQTVYATEGSGSPDQSASPNTTSDIPSDTPTSTSSFLMVGGNWVTPVATYGQTVNVVLPVVNMGNTNLGNVIITPVISTATSEWPFEIQTSGTTQVIKDLPGRNTGVSDMDRRRELTWSFKTRSDVLSGYYKLQFNVIYYVDGNPESATLTTFIRTVGAPGSGTVGSADGKNSTPRVVVTGFDTEPAEVYAGDTFTLKIHLKNTSQRTAVSNMEVNLAAAVEGKDATATYAAFLPTSGSNTVYIDKIGRGGTADISIEMTAKADLAQKPYQLDVKMDYEDEKYLPFSATSSVSIPIRQEAKFDVSSIEVLPPSIEVGGESNVMFSIYNTGKTTLYNVQVKFQGDSITGGDTFVGKIDVGGTGTVDTMITGAAPTMDDGTIKAIITYEDDAGNQSTLEKELNLYVTEAMMEDPMMDPNGEMPVEEGGNSHVGLIIAIVGVLLVTGGVTTFLVIRKKKKKKLQEEEESLISFEEISSNGENSGKEE